MKLFTKRVAIASVLTFGYMSAMASPIGGLGLPITGLDKVLEISENVANTGADAVNTATNTGADFVNKATDTGADAVNKAAVTGADFVNKATDTGADAIKTGTETAKTAVGEVASTASTVTDNAEITEELEKTNVVKGLL
ncbi:MAG TPA: hypothetical protein ACHBZA_11400 [Arsenophonus apicola]|uniref:hypothetical protein n=1 Tax=Arsenophonus TaxID=637 RepID=UPI0015D75A6B|nr:MULTISPECIES: hypothetical protein [Arsenophonus]UBX28770.1 hypothetical protein LDL57_13440 [Arsenophonus apicola]